MKLENLLDKTLKFDTMKVMIYSIIKVGLKRTNSEINVLL